MTAETERDALASVLRLVLRKPYVDAAGVAMSTGGAWELDPATAAIVRRALDEADR